MNKGLIFIFSILILFFDDNILTLIGYPHKDPDAANIFKIHPIGYLSISVLAYSIFIGKIKASTLKRDCKLEMVLIAFCAVLIVYILALNRFSNMSFIIDALITPAAVSILLKHTSNSTLQSQQKLIYIAFTLNFALALVEKVLHRPILSTEYLKLFPDFRSTALYGHPLNNALIMSTIGILLYLFTENFVIKIAVLFLTIVAILCFGARGATIGIVGGVALSFVIDIFYKNIKSNVKNIAGIIIIAIASVWVLTNTSIGDRVLKKTSFQNDNSAQERVRSLHLLEMMSPDQLQWGMSDPTTDILMRQGGVKIIENYFVVWVTRFGIYLSIILATILVGFVIKQIRSFNKLALLPVLFTFLFVASINNSLASKTRAITVLTLCCYVLRKDKTITFLITHPNDNA